MNNIIETLHSLGEDVFFLHNNEVLSGRVSSNNIDFTDINTITVTVDITQKYNHDKYDSYTRKETQVFKTKEDLLKSL